MSKFKMFDEQGKEIFFDYAVDAREAAATGKYFEVNPVEAPKKEIPVEAPKKKGKPVKENVDGVATDDVDAMIDEE